MKLTYEGRELILVILVCGGMVAFMVAFSGLLSNNSLREIILIVIASGATGFLIGTVCGYSRAKKMLKEYREQCEKRVK